MPIKSEFEQFKENNQTLINNLNKAARTYGRNFEDTYFEKVYKILSRYTAICNTLISKNSNLNKKNLEDIIIPQLYNIKEKNLQNYKNSIEKQVFNEIQKIANEKSSNIDFPNQFNFFKNNIVHFFNNSKIISQEQINTFLNTVNEDRTKIQNNNQNLKKEEELKQEITQTNKQIQDLKIQNQEKEQTISKLMFKQDSLEKTNLEQLMKIEELKQKNQDQNKQIQNQNEKITQLKTDKQNLEDENQQLKKAMLLLQQQLEQQKKQIQKLQQQQDDLNVQNALQGMSDYMDSIEQKEEENNLKKENIQLAEQHQKDVDQHLMDENEKKLLKEDLEKEKQITQIQEEKIKELTAKLQQKEEELQKQNEQINELVNINKNLTEQNAILIQNNQEQTKQIENIDKQLNEKNQQLQKQEEQLAEQREGIGVKSNGDFDINSLKPNDINNKEVKEEQDKENKQEDNNIKKQQLESINKNDQISLTPHGTEEDNTQEILQSKENNIIESNTDDQLNIQNIQQINNKGEITNKIELSDNKFDNVFFASFCTPNNNSMEQHSVSNTTSELEINEMFKNEENFDTKTVFAKELQKIANNIAAKPKDNYQEVIENLTETAKQSGISFGTAAILTHNEKKKPIISIAEFGDEEGRKDNNTHTLVELTNGQKLIIRSVNDPSLNGKKLSGDDKKRGFAVFQVDENGNEVLMGTKDKIKGTNKTFSDVFEINVVSKAKEYLKEQNIEKQQQPQTQVQQPQTKTQQQPKQQFSESSISSKLQKINEENLKDEKNLSSLKLSLLKKQQKNVKSQLSKNAKKLQKQSSEYKSMINHYKCETTLLMKVNDNIEKINIDINQIDNLLKGKDENNKKTYLQKVAKESGRYSETTEKTINNLDSKTITKMLEKRKKTLEKQKKEILSETLDKTSFLHSSKTMEQELKTKSNRARLGFEILTGNTLKVNNNEIKLVEHNMEEQNNTKTAAKEAIKKESNSHEIDKQIKDIAKLQEKLNSMIGKKQDLEIKSDKIMYKIEAEKKNIKQNNNMKALSNIMINKKAATKQAVMTSDEKQKENQKQQNLQS